MRIYRHDLPSAASPLALEEDFFFSSCSWGGGSALWKFYEDHHEDVYGKPMNHEKLSCFSSSFV